MQVIRIVGERLAFDPGLSTAELHDSLAIVKRDRTRNTLVEGGSST
jgi:hypothetical protein